MTFSVRRHRLFFLFFFFYQYLQDFNDFFLRLLQPKNFFLLLQICDADIFLCFFFFLENYSNCWNSKHAVLLLNSYQLMRAVLNTDTRELKRTLVMRCCDDVTRTRLSTALVEKSAAVFEKSHHVSKYLTILRSFLRSWPFRNLYSCCKQVRTGTCFPECSKTLTKRVNYWLQYVFHHKKVFRTCSLTWTNGCF